MIRFRRLSDVATDLDKLRLAAAQDIYQRAFPRATEYAKNLARLIRTDAMRDFEVVLLLAEGPKRRVLGFSLFFVFPRLRFGYLDYLASDPAKPGRGIGGALYEATCELLVRKGARALFLEALTDDKEKVNPQQDLNENRRLLRFYEECGARPVAGTLFDSLPTKANQGWLTFLLHDGLGLGAPLRRATLKRVLQRVYEAKYGMGADDPEVKRVVGSVRDDPVPLRPPRYARTPALPAPARRLKLADIVVVSDQHSIHHLRERGYVERPARVYKLLEGIDDLPITRCALRPHGMAAVRAIHDARLLAFLERTGSQLAPGVLLYPDVFPQRRWERLPRVWEAQAGYFCIDTSTPLTRDVFQAARGAVDCALTGADLLLEGSHLTYALCRPPGHHAGRRVFGGFCYLNNAAVAAHRLAARGRVALVDVDYHHGNGTQELFYQRNDVYFLSIHGHPNVAYPYFSGFADEQGEGEGRGYTRNYPLFPEVDDAGYVEVLDDALKHVQRFKPDWLVISLGHDTMRGDPTGRFSVTPAGMRRMGERFGRLGVPALIVQEGGYSLRNLRRGSRAFLLGMSEMLY